MAGHCVHRTAQVQVRCGLTGFSEGTPPWWGPRVQRGGGRLTESLGSHPVSYVRPAPGGCLVRVRVQPRASRTRLIGPHGEGAGVALKVTLTTPPVDGQANKALLKLLGKLLSLPPSSLEIRRGDTSRVKEVFVPGIDAADALDRLSGG